MTPERIVARVVPDLLHLAVTASALLFLEMLDRLGADEGVVAVVIQAMDVVLILENSFFVEPGLVIASTKAIEVAGLNRIASRHKVFVIDHVVSFRTLRAEVETNS